MQKKLVYVDTDVGLGTPGAEIDDGAALIFLLRNPDVEVIGAGSIFGNVLLQDAALNLDRMLNWMDADSVPIALGAAQPILADMTWFRDWQSAYGKTLPWAPRPVNVLAANLIVHLVETYPNEVSILSLGPMTNLALAIRLQPEIIPLTSEIVVMGGSFNQQDPFPEFNARCDPEAAQIVLNAGWTVHTLGLNITRRVHFSRREFASLPDDNPAIELLRTQAPGWIDRIEEMGWDQDGCALHDAVAAAYLMDETLFQTRDTSVEVELSDPRLRGATRISSTAQDGSIVKMITDVDAEKCRDLIWSNIHR